MIPLVTHGFASAPADSLADAVQGALGALARHLAARGTEASRLVSLTVFAAPEERAAAEAAVAAEVRALAGDGVPVSALAQPPATGRLALEATWVHPGVADARLERLGSPDAPHVLLTCGDLRQLHAGGPALGSGDPDPDAQADEALAGAAAILAAAGMDFGHVVRQWNTIGRMLDCVPDARQRYQIFNDARTKAYAACTFPHGYPAATGIGQAVERTQVELIALDGPGVRIESRSNPEQVDAHRYSDAVLPGAVDPELHAKTPPKFERAVALESSGGHTVLVSGTASIVGEQSVGAGDVVAQTRTTLHHIDTLLEGRAPTHLRVYVKHAKDVPAVRNVCQAAHGPVPATYVIADVCRDELLVEIEAARVAPAS